jgi:membrane associated rhomboid family serine protease
MHDGAEMIRIRDTNRKPLPAATLIIALLTAVISVVALGNPEILRTLERHPTAEPPWLSWHLLSPLFVHDGWIPLTFNLAGLVLVGTTVEHRIGTARWIVLYFLGGITGEILGMQWQPIGAGNSVASFGLLGGLLALLLDDTSDLPMFVLFYAFGWVASYAGLAFGGASGSVAAAVVCAPLGAVIVRAHARGAPMRTPGVVLGCGMLLGALLLSAHRDIHGPPLIIGMIAGLLLRVPQRRDGG